MEKMHLGAAPPTRVRADPIILVRLLGGLLIVAGLLSVAVAVLFLKDFPTASAWFQLVQGVVLGILGWLFGSQGLDREVARADEEARKAGAAAQTTAEGLERLAMVEAALAEATALLRALINDPASRGKVEEAVRPLGGHADDSR